MSNFNGGFTILVILFVILTAMFTASASIALYIGQKRDIKILEGKLENAAPASSCLPTLVESVVATTTPPVVATTTFEI